MIEVMLSMAVIGMVIGGAYTISNRTTQLSRMAEQRTQVNNLLKSQAELLKLARDTNSATSPNVFQKFKTDSSGELGSETTTAVDGKNILCDKPITDFTSNKSFYMTQDLNNKTDYTLTPPETRPAYSSNSGVDSSGQYQIFIVGFPNNTLTPAYIDFYIVGCWQGPGAYRAQQSFIVERLNTL